MAFVDFLGFLNVALQTGNLRWEGRERMGGGQILTVALSTEPYLGACQTSIIVPLRKQLMALNCLPPNFASNIMRN